MSNKGIYRTGLRNPGILLLISAFLTFKNSWPYGPPIFKWRATRV